MSATKRPRLVGPAEDEATVTDAAEQVLHSNIRFPDPKSFADSTPYPHGQVDPILDPAFYQSLRAEVKSLQHIRKETDLFKLAQSPDWKNLDLNPQLHGQLPCIMKLRKVLYSDSFRLQVEKSAGLPPNTLTGKTDLASSIYTKVLAVTKLKE